MEKMKNKMRQIGVVLVTLVALAVMIETVMAASAYPHTVDGEFTDWLPAPNTPAQYEWFDITPLEARFKSTGELVAYWYSDQVLGEGFYIMNDFVIRTIPIDDSIVYQHFRWTDPNDGAIWEIELRATSFTVWRNGVEQLGGGGIIAVAGFAKSPNLDINHTMYELIIPFAIIGNNPITWWDLDNDDNPIGGCPEGSPNAGDCYTPETPEDGCCEYPGGCYDGISDPAVCTVCYDGTWHPGQYCEGDECIPEFTTIAIPVVTIIGLLFLFSRRRRKP